MILQHGQTSEHQPLHEILGNTFPPQTILLLATHRPRCTFLSHTLFPQPRWAASRIDWSNSLPVCIKQSKSPNMGAQDNTSFSCRYARVTDPLFSHRVSVFVSPTAPVREGATYVYLVMISQCCRRRWYMRMAEHLLNAFWLEPTFPTTSSERLLFRTASGSPPQSLKAPGLSPIRPHWNLS